METICFETITTDEFGIIANTEIAETDVSFIPLPDGQEIELCQIKGGMFGMGSALETADFRANEQPFHTEMYGNGVQIFGTTTM